MAKLVGAGIVLVAARHNRRAIQAEAHAGGSIDPARSRLNYRLVGPDSPEEVAVTASSRVKAAGLYKLRKDAVRAIELVFSLPVTAEIEHRAYFADCVRWAGDRFGGIDNVLSADVHLDESAPHCHVLILPLIGGRMVGSELVGGPKVLAGHLTSFQEAVAVRYGLRRPPPRLSTSDRRALAAAVLRRLREITDPALRSAAWAVVRDAIERDPVPWAATLGVTACGRQAKAMKSMADIFTGKGKGPQKEREPSNPKGFEAGVADRSLCSVGFGSEMTPCLADVTAQIELNDALVSSWVSTESATVGDELATADQAVDGWAPVDPEFRANVFERSGCIGERGESTRTRDSQRLAISWCVERGEFVDLPAEPQRPSRAAAESWVSTQLARAS